MDEKVNNDTEVIERNGRTTCGERAMPMFHRIIHSNAIIKSQQRDERELTISEKIEYLDEMYCQHPVKILQRFGKHMYLEDLELFKESDNYEIFFYVNKLRPLLDPVQKENVVKNRRYNYLKNVLRESDYFQDHEMEKRNPLLYKQYIGQYITDDEFKKHRKEERNFSEFLFNKIDKNINDFRCDLQERACDEEEYDEDSSDEENIENDNDFKMYLEEKVPMEDDERIRLRKEFVCLMENEFIMGDTNFDYSTVDNDEQYDNLNDQDIEDHYFDDEEACEVETDVDGTNHIGNSLDNAD